MSEEWEDSPEAANWREQDERDAFEDYRDCELTRQAEHARRQELKDRFDRAYQAHQRIDAIEPPRIHQWRPRADGQESPR